MPADGVLNSDSQDNDPFPTALNNSLTSTTDPRLSFYTNYRVTDLAGIKGIAKNHDNTISFRYTPLNTTAAITSLPADNAAQPSTAYTLSGVKTDRQQAGRRQIVIVKDKEGKGCKVY